MVFTDASMVGFAVLMLVSQELWNLMLAVTSNSSQARPAGASMVAPAA
jgi:hypothetical protein